MSTVKTVCVIFLVTLCVLGFLLIIRGHAVVSLDSVRGMAANDYNLPPVLLDSLTLSHRKRPYIWMCWPKTDTMPAYLEMCVECVAAFNKDVFEVTLVTPHNLAQFLTDVHPAYPYLSYVHKTDYLRCLLLHQHGGIYMDVDTLSFAPLREVARLLTRFDVVGYDGSPWNEIWGVSVMMGRRHTSYSSEWVKRLHAKLDQKHNELSKFRRNNPTALNEDCLKRTEVLRDIVLPLSFEMRDEISWKIIPSHLLSASIPSDMIDNTRANALKNTMYSSCTSSRSDIMSAHNENVLFRALTKAHNMANIFMKNKVACNVDACYILNLDHRLDRWAQVQDTIRKCFISTVGVKRHAAPYVRENGAIGCLMGHLEILKRSSKEHPFENIIILEDDVVPTGINFQTALENAFSTPSVAFDWDVMLVACNMQSDEEVSPLCPVRRLKEGQTTAAYLVRAGYVQTLIDLYSSTLHEAKSNKWDDKYCADQCWKSLQQKHMWYYFSPALMKQKPSFSDIDKMFSDHGF